jgi:hypothetical protein
MSNRINTLALAKKIQKESPLASIRKKYKKFRKDLEIICHKRKILFDIEFPPNKYTSCSPSYYSTDYFNSVCFCKNLESKSLTCFHFTTYPCDEGMTNVYCWHENGTIKKHKVGKCPHSEYRVVEE